MTFQQFLLILKVRYRIVVFTPLIVVLIAFVASLFWPKQYTATTSVVIDVKSPDPVAGMVIPGLAAPGYMATQVDIINSDRVAQRVVKLLRMDESPAIRDQWMEGTGGTGELKVWLADLLKQNLDVKPSRESNVIDIEYKGVDPAFAAAIANAFAQAYVDVNLELKVEPARRYATWFDGQTRSLRDKLEKARQALSDYQQQTGIVATEERLDHETSKLHELSTQLTIAQAQTSENRSKRKSAGSSETLSEVIQNPLINGLKADVARLEAKLQESNVNLGKNHPQTQRAQSELAVLKAELAREIKRVSSSIGTTYEVGKHKEKELLEALEVQKVRLLELNKQRDQISVLQRDVEAAQRNFEGINLRAAQVKLESDAVQTNIAVLTPASVPTEPSRPRILLNVMIALFFGVILGVSIALILEFNNRYIRSEQDLADLLEIPVLVTISSPVSLLSPRQQGSRFRKLPFRARSA